MSKIGKN